MTRLGLTAATLAIALLLVFLGTRAGETASVFAQSDATPTAPDADRGGDRDDDGRGFGDAPDAAAAYTDFLTKFAANLGLSDAAQVDAAVRTSLKQRIDERQLAGDLTVAEATALKERIDTAEAPFFPGGFGGRGHHGGGGDDRGGQDGAGRGDDDGRDGAGPDGSGRGGDDVDRGAPGLPEIPDAPADATPAVVL